MAVILLKMKILSTSSYSRKSCFRCVVVVFRLCKSDSSSHGRIKVKQ